MSEITTRVLRQYNIEVAHKPTHKLAANFTRHKDRTADTDHRNAIYMFPCLDCPQQYIGEISMKVETRLTEHRNAIKRHNPKSLPVSHADNYEHSFNWSQTKIVGQTTTRHARKFKETWHSMDRSTFNRHINIPTICHQLKQTQNPRLSSLSSTTGTHPTNIQNATTYIYIEFNDESLL